MLAHLNKNNHKQILTLITNFHKKLNKHTIKPQKHQILNHLIPHLLNNIYTHKNTTITLSHITTLLIKIITHTTYLKLLNKFPTTLKHLISLYTTSPIITNQLTHYPLLLNKLLNPNTLYQPTTTNTYHNKLHQYLLHIPKNNKKQQLKTLHQFKQTQLLHITTTNITNTLPIIKINNHLT